MTRFSDFLNAEHGMTAFPTDEEIKRHAQEYVKACIEIINDEGWKTRATRQRGILRDNGVMENNNMTAAEQFLSELSEVGDLIQTAINVNASPDQVRIPFKMDSGLLLQWVDSLQLPDNYVLKLFAKLAQYFRETVNTLVQGVDFDTEKTDVEL